MDDHRTELTTEELQHLNQQQQKQVAEEISSGEEEGGAGTIPKDEIRDLLRMWSKTQAVFEKWHPNKALVNRCVNLFNDNIIDHFRKVQKGCHDQTTLERWFSKDTTTSDPKPSTSDTLAKGIKRQRMQTPFVSK